MFLQWALPRMGFRWGGFRRVRRQVCRRIDARRQVLGLADIADYKAYLETHPAEFAVLDGFCRITISRFYRDRAVFDHLRDMILPMLARAAGARPARAWCVGCASGEEPYSLRLAWRLGSAAGGGGLHIIATDTEPRVLERA
jgi:chemotaxis protein methyltransferase CheR